MLFKSMSWQGFGLKRNNVADVFYIDSKLLYGDFGGLHYAGQFT